MFETIERKGGIKEEGRKEMMVKRAMGTVAEHKDEQLIGKRVRKWEREYFRFIGYDLDPTNKAAELTIRQSVVERVVTQGSQGIAGKEWHERFWTVLTTCTVQNISVMKYLKECLWAYFGMGSYPNLINPA
jgi:hypothetical protein